LDRLPSEKDTIATAEKKKKGLGQKHWSMNKFLNLLTESLLGFALKPLKVTEGLCQL
jgi:hypothetical protein